MKTPKSLKEIIDIYDRNKAKKLRILTQITEITAYLLKYAKTINYRQRQSFYTIQRKLALDYVNIEVINK